MSERPGASLREIAREAGISPATVRDVRQRVSRGDSPVPSGGRRPAPMVGRSVHDAVPSPAQSPTGSPAGQSPVQSPVQSPSAVGGGDPARLVQSLRRDPSLRFSEAGRALIAWLNVHATGVDGWRDLLERIPPHCTYVLADVARACAAEWAAFADELGRHGDADADRGHVRDTVA